MTTQPIRNVELAVDRRGSGPTLVWGHGLTSSRAADDASGLLDWSALAERVDLVRYDALGHGESETVEDLGRYHWSELALDQLALLEALEIDAAVVGGASMGAATALHLAVHLAGGGADDSGRSGAPELRGLVLMIPPTGWETRAGQTEVYERLATVAEDEGVEAVLDARADVPPPDPLVGDDVYRDSREDALRALGPDRLATVFRGAADTDLPSHEQIAAIDVPTLLLAWSGDAGHPESTAERLRELIDGSVLRMATARSDVAGWTADIAAFVEEHGAAKS